MDESEQVHTEESSIQVAASQEDLKLEENVTTSKVQMKRELGLVGASSIVIGLVIGSGIFVSPKGVLRATGSVGLCLLVWGVAGVAQLASALCYAELGAMIPKAGGAYTYLRTGIGNPLAFIYALQLVLMISPGAMVVVLLTFAKYTITLLPVCGSPVYLERFIAAAALVTLAIVNTYSSRLAARLAIITTVGKLGALITIIIGGIIAISQGTTTELGSGFSGTSNDASSLALAMYSANFAYGGGENLNIVAEEIKNPSRNLPRALLLGIFLVIVIYILTNVAYLSVMTRAELLAAEAVAGVFADRVLGAGAKIIPVAVMVSTFGSANNALFSMSRLVYAAAKDNNFPDVLSYIQVNQLTPLCAMAVMVTLSLILLVPGDISSLMNYIGFLSAFFSGCVYISLILFRLKSMKEAERPIKVPLVIPVFMLLVSVYLFVAPLVISPDLNYVYIAAALLGTGTLLYIPFIHFGLALPGYDKFVTWIQLAFQVSPPTKTD